MHGYNVQPISYQNLSPNDNTLHDNFMQMTVKGREKNQQHRSKDKLSVYYSNLKDNELSMHKAWFTRDTVWFTELMCS